MAWDYHVHEDDGRLIHQVIFKMDEGMLDLIIDSQQLQKMSDQKERHRWMINGTFFSEQSIGNAPTYFLMKNKQPLALSHNAHGAIGWDGHDVLWDVIRPKVTLKLDHQKVVKVGGINQMLGAVSIWPKGSQMPSIVQQKSCLLYVDEQGNAYQASKINSQNDWGVLFKRCPNKLPRVIKLSVEFNGRVYSERAWESMEYVVMGVPLLVSNGQAVLTQGESAFYQFPYARTVIGQLVSGEISWVVVESNLMGLYFFQERGYWPSFLSPKGMSLPELTQWLIQHDFEYALNLDGGGSSGLVVDGQQIVSPTKTDDVFSMMFERPVSHFISFKPH